METALLPLYKAISIKELAIDGGTSKPCILDIDTGNGAIVPYVVKILKQSYLKNGHPIQSEVFANVLACAFDLKTPNIALIDVPNWIISEVRIAPQYAGYGQNELQASVYFGSEYIENNQDYSEPLRSRHLTHADCALIFAFDTFILHCDRRTAKPNLFFKDEDVFLIDHESALLIGSQTYQTLWQRGEYLTNQMRIDRPHLFLDYLRKNKTKIDFSLFHEYLKYLNTNILDAYAEKIVGVMREKNRTHEGDDNFHYAPIKNYLCEVKSNAPHFIEQLTELINT